MGRTRHSDYDEVLRLHETGDSSLGDIARSLGMSKNTVASIVRRHVPRSGVAAPQERDAAAREQRAVLEYLLRERGARTLRDLQEALSTEHNSVSIPTLWRKVRALGFVKNGRCYAEDTDFFISPNSGTSDSDYWRPFRLKISALRPDSFQHVPLPWTPIAARITLGHVLLIAEALKPRCGGYPKKVEDYVLAKWPITRKGLLPIHFVVEEYKAETCVTRENRRMWRWRILCAITYSANDLISLYTDPGVELGKSAFREILSGLTMAAALAQGHDDIESWKEALRKRKEEIAAQRAAAARARRTRKK